MSVRAIDQQRRERYARAVTVLREGLAEGRSDVRARFLLIALHEQIRAAGPLSVNAKLAAPTHLVEPRLPGKQVEDYGLLVKRLRARAVTLVPQGAQVLVVSRGDNALLRLKGVVAAHFPQDEAGAWAGFYPPDSETALAHLDQLRRAGAEFLLFPATTVWWLEYYERFASHLLTKALVVHHDEDLLLFDLRPVIEVSPAAS